MNQSTPILAGKAMTGLAAFFLALSAGRLTAKETTNLPPVLPPLDFFQNKSPLPDLLLKDKREGRYVTGFPAIGADAETGLTYGFALQWYDNGQADSPFFRYTPYRQRLSIGAVTSTGGSTRALIGFDQPYIGESPWRLRLVTLLQRNEFENYFGIGESTLGPLTYPGSTRAYSNFDDYQSDLDQVVNGQTWKHYNQYLREEAQGGIVVERDCLGGLLRPHLGLRFSRVNVDDYTGQNISGGIMQPTRLLEDLQAGRIQGFDGGWDNGLQIGVTFDTRDFEPDPSAGVMLQIVGRVSPEWMGSDFDYQKISVDLRGFYNLLGDSRRLVLAGRFLYLMQFGDVPFYSAPTIPLTDGDIQGLGGHATLQGFVTDRFVGECMALAASELRWTVGEVLFLKQHLRFMLVPFVETGCVFDTVSDTTLERWKFAGGAGLRLAWNLSTVISFDYGVSGERSAFYMEIAHQF